MTPATRGQRSPASGTLSLVTDTHKALWLDVGVDGKHSWITGLTNWGAKLAMTIQAASNVDLAVGAEWSERDDPLQYVDQACRKGS